MPKICLFLASFEMKIAPYSPYGAILLFLWSIKRRKRNQNLDFLQLIISYLQLLNSSGLDLASVKQTYDDPIFRVSANDQQYNRYTHLTKSKPAQFRRRLGLDFCKLRGYCRDLIERE